MNSKKISVVIPCLKSNRLIKKNLKLLEEDKRIREVIIVKDIGIGEARDVGLRKVKNDLILWLDSDIELTNNPINDFLEILKRDKKIAGVVATVKIKPTNWKNYLLSVINEIIYECCMPKEHNSVTRLFDCSLFRRRPLLKSGFDHSFIYSAEDADIYQKLKKSKYNVITTQKVKVFHHQNFSDLPKIFLKYKKGIDQFILKYGLHPNKELLKYRPSIFKLSLLSFKKLFLKDKKPFLAFAFPFFGFYLWLMKKIVENEKFRQEIFIGKYLKNYIKSKINPELIKPKVASLLVTENCFFKCKTCTFWKKRSKDLSFREIKHVLDECKKFGIKKIVLLGGEPLLRKDLIRICQEIKDRKMKIELITNGFIENEDIINFDWESVSVSIDGIKPLTHDKIRGVKGSWRRAVKTVQKLIKRRKNVRINFVIQRDNYKELKQMFKFCKKRNIQFIPFFCNLCGLGQESDKNLIKFDLNKLNKEITIWKNDTSFLSLAHFYYMNFVLKKLERKIKKQKCMQPHINLTIRSNGDVYPCSSFDKSIGNIFKNSLETIWRKSKVLRRNIRQGSYEFCNNCISICLVENLAFELSYYVKLPLLLMKNRVIKWLS